MRKVDRKKNTNKNKMRTRCLWRDRSRCGFPIDFYGKTIRSGKGPRGRKQQSLFLDALPRLQLSKVQKSYNATVGCDRTWVKSGLDMKFKEATSG